MIEESPYDVIDGVRDGHVGHRAAHGGKRWPSCWHRWLGESHGAWYYQECKKCGRRRVTRSNYSVMGPVDLHWVLTGEWREMKLPPSMVTVGGMPPTDAKPPYGGTD